MSPINISKESLFSNESLLTEVKNSKSLFSFLENDSWKQTSQNKAPRKESSLFFTPSKKQNHSFITTKQQDHLFTLPTFKNQDHSFTSTIFDKSFDNSQNYFSPSKKVYFVDKKRLEGNPNIKYNDLNVSIPMWVSQDEFEKNQQKLDEASKYAEKLRKLSKKYKQDKKSDPIGFSVDENKLELIRQKLNKGSPQEVMVDQGNNGQQVTIKDLFLLLGNNWLNDVIINSYMYLILSRNLLHYSKNTSKKWPKCFVFQSYFLLRLGESGYSYSNVRRWTKRAKVDIFSLDKIIVPVHLGNHWCLAVINMVLKRIEYYDSLLGYPSCMKLLKKYLKDEWKDKKYSVDSSLNPEFNLDGWVEYVPTDIPRQTNGYDCGIFACKYADYISRDFDFDFSQADIPKIRSQMLIEILENDLK